MLDTLSSEKSKKELLFSLLPAIYVAMLQNILDRNCSVTTFFGPGKRLIYPL